MSSAETSSAYSPDPLAHVHQLALAGVYNTEMQSAILAAADALDHLSPQQQFSKYIELMRYARGVSGVYQTDADGLARNTSLELRQYLMERALAVPEITSDTYNHATLLYYQLDILEMQLGHYPGIQHGLGAKYLPARHAIDKKLRAHARRLLDVTEAEKDQIPAFRSYRRAARYCLRRMQDIEVDSRYL